MMMIVVDKGRGWIGLFCFCFFLCCFFRTKGNDYGLARSRGKGEGRKIKRVSTSHGKTERKWTKRRKKILSLKDRIIQSRKMGGYHRCAHFRIRESNGCRSECCFVFRGCFFCAFSFAWFSSRPWSFWALLLFSLGCIRIVVLFRLLLPFCV